MGERGRISGPVGGTSSTGGLNMSIFRTEVDAVDDLVLVHRARVPLPVADCFGLFTEVTGLESWLCAKARVEPHVGGRYELFWDPADPENDSTIGCRITAFERDQLLAFQWRSPRQFKPFANAADPLTHVVVSFHAEASGTAVTLVHSGWRSSPPWQQAAEWQAAAWGHAFRALPA